MCSQVPPALTVGEIARRFGAPVHRVEYVIRSRSIQPQQRAGNARIFSEADVTYIEQVLRRIAAERQGDRHD